MSRLPKLPLVLALAFAPASIAQVTMEPGLWHLTTKSTTRRITAQMPTFLTRLFKTWLLAAIVNPAGRAPAIAAAAKKSLWLRCSF